MGWSVPRVLWWAMWLAASPFLAVIALVALCAFPQFLVFGALIVVWFRLLFWLSKG